MLGFVVDGPLTRGTLWNAFTFQSLDAAFFSLVYCLSFVGAS